MDDTTKNDPTSAEQQIEAMWDGIARFGSARSEQALDFMLNALCQLVDAQSAFWVGAVQLSGNGKPDPLNHWRPQSYHLFKGHTDSKQVAQETQSRIKRGDIDPTFIASIREAGQFRIYIRHQNVDDSWYQSEYYKTFIEPYGVSDAIIVATPVGDRVESLVGLIRSNHPSTHFNETDSELLTLAMRPMKWFHHQLVLEHGLLLADNPLTPSERRVLKALLSEATEAEIGQQLALSPTTVHTYAKQIYRKYGVRGRTGLTALWLGQPGSR